MVDSVEDRKNRIWITDPDHSFDRMNFFDMLFNPLGKTPITHFRRGWLFLVILALFTILLIQGLGGALNSPGAASGMGTIILLLLLVTTFGTVSMHMRRATDAGKSKLRALVVLLPLFLTVPAAYFGGSAGLQEHRVELVKFLHTQDAEALKASDPDGFDLAVKTKAEEKKAREEAIRKAREQAASGQRPRRGGRGGRGRGRGGWSGKQEQVDSQLSFVFKKSVEFATPVWAATSFIAMLFSLISFARWPSKP